MHSTYYTLFDSRKIGCLLKHVDKQFQLEECRTGEADYFSFLANGCKYNLPRNELHCLLIGQRLLTAQDNARDQVGHIRLRIKGILSKQYRLILAKVDALL